MPFAVLAFVVLLLLGSPAHAGLQDLFFWRDKNPFTIHIDNDRNLASDMKDQLKRERDENPELRQLTDRSSIARYEANIFSRYLRSKGYYSSEIAWDLTNNRINYRITPGPLYRIAELTFDLPAVDPALDVETLRLHKGEPLDAANVIAARNRIEKHYAEHSCLYQIKVTYDARVDHAKHEASLHLALAPSEPAVFGEVRFVGDEHIQAKHLANYLDFESGECFSRKLLDESRLALLQSGLLASTEITVQPPQEGRADMIYKVTERQARTLKGGVSYDADAGGGVALDWEHRNMFGRGEKLALTSEFSELSSKLGSQLTLQHFLAKSQNLVLHANTERETPDAFTSTKADLGATINRRLTQYVTVGLGVETLFSRVEEDGSQEDYGLLGFPFSIDINRRDEIFDPKKGWNLGSKTEAFWDAYHSNIGFQKSTLAASYYYTKEDIRLQPTLALRLATGVILGEDLATIPADERFYVGGGGSVRGYAYQSLGQLTDNKPDGSLSFGETSAEVRVRFNRAWGLVVFVDGGWAYAEKEPNWGQDFLWGAGLGIRYYTTFAPIRFDIATPINRRAEIDDPVQLYISIGQAF